MVPFSFAGETFFASAEGALFWPAQSALLVADLHLEKASWFARLGQFLPPYNSHATLSALAARSSGPAPPGSIASATVSTTASAATGFPNRRARCSAPSLRGSIGPGSSAITIPALPIIAAARSPTRWQFAASFFATKRSVARRGRKSRATSTPSYGCT